MAALSQLTEDDFKSAQADERSAVAAKAVQAAATPEEKEQVATAAVDALDAAERAKFVSGLIPQHSADRKVVYVVGFWVSAVLALGLALIAWGAADSGNDGVGTAAIAAALSLPSAIIGGLLGAYVSRQ